MRKMLVFVVLFMATPAFAQDFYYLVDKDGKVIDKQGKPYYQTGMESRGELQVKSTQDIPLRKAEYSNGVVSAHVNTPEEDAAENAKKKLSQEEKAIKRRMRKLAMDSLKAEGVVFEQVTEQGD
jgi:hypothetical protein